MQYLNFLKIIKILSSSYMKDFDEETCKIWYMQFKDINETNFSTSVNNIIKTSKFMPSISELLDECDKYKKHYKFMILERMNNQNYFGSRDEYLKASHFIETDCIPIWLKEDMKKFNVESIADIEILKLNM